MKTITKTRTYKGYCIFDTYWTLYTNPYVRINPLAGKRHVKAYGIDGFSGKIFETVKQAKAYIDNKEI